MAIVEMTKMQVVEAISKERLTMGTWASSNGQNKNDPAGSGCSFCAVGATVRAAMSDSVAFYDVREIAETLGNEDDTLYELSEAYENAAAYSQSDDVAIQLEAGRAAAIAFVQSPAFPDVIHIDIGSASPRRGMKVVRP